MVKPTSRLIAVLDIGTTKMVCFIATLSNHGKAEIIGIGHQISEGIRAGTITDIKAAENAILSCVDTAERMAGEHIEQIYVNIAAGKLSSTTVRGEITLSGGEVTQRDITKLLNLTLEKYADDNHQIIHSLPIEYSIDDETKIKDPTGIYGKTLGVKLHLITTPNNIIMNLSNCLARCHLDVIDYIASPYAAAIACLTTDEKELGVTHIDIGGGHTSIASFCNGNLVHTDSVPLGGHHITKDIACGLSTDITSAERIKNLYGNALITRNNSKEIIEVPQLGNDEDDLLHHQFSKTDLADIIQPRIEEIFELINARLTQANVALDQHIVFSGGSSQLMGLKDYASNYLGKKVRIGSPTMIPGLAESTRSAAFANAVGMLHYVIGEALDETLTIQRYSPMQSFFNKASHWFKENF